jgi:hypothetical protein
MPPGKTAAPPAAFAPLAKSVPAPHRISRLDGTKPPFEARINAWLT